MSTNDRLARQIRRTALVARFEGLTTRQRNARIRRLTAALDSTDETTAHAAVWA